MGLIVLAIVLDSAMAGRGLWPVLPPSQFVGFTYGRSKNIQYGLCG